MRSFQASQISVSAIEIKRKRKAGRSNNTTLRHTKFVRERLNASGCITSGKSKNKHDRSSIKDYGNLSNVVLENNSNLLNHNYKTIPLTKCQSATTKVNEEKNYLFH